MSLYEDDFIKYFQLKYSTYPYRVVYTYKTTRTTFIEIAGWTPVQYTDIPALDAKLKVIIPKDVPYHQYANNISVCRLDSSVDKYSLEWETSYKKPIKSEIFSQVENCKPKVVIQPLQIDYGVKGNLGDWKSFGNWQYRLNQDLDVLPDDEKNTISALIKGVSDKREIVRALYHYLQDHTRYINVSIGIGGLKPYPASYVAKNKFGDCKALSNYMKAMLKFAGIESFYTIVYAGIQPRDIIDNLPGEQFNHIVLAVPLKNDTIWLENTDNTNPFGYMGTFTQNREALLVSRDNSRLVHIPTLSKEECHVSNKVDFDLDVNGNAKAVLHRLLRGYDFELFNQVNLLLNGDQKDRFIRDHIPFDNGEVTYWELKKPNRDTTWIELNEALNLKNVLKPLGKEYYFSSYPVEIPDFSVNRKLPVDLPFPVYETDTIVYNLPAAYEMKTQPDSMVLASKFGDYEQKFYVSNGKILVIKKFELFPGRYSLEQYPEYYKFIQTVRVMDEKKIIIKKI